MHGVGFRPSCLDQNLVYRSIAGITHSYMLKDKAESPIRKIITTELDFFGKKESQLPLLWQQ